jgi:23S rRNA (adenine-N6)-dimethyltransferase
VAAPDARRWGWHRLSRRAASRLVAAAGVSPGQLILDVGAGDGAITAALVDRRARVVAVELHPARAALLRQRFAGQPVVVVQADARDLWLPRRPFGVVANPPFGVVTQLLRRLMAPGSRLERASLAVPLHVAERWSSGNVPGSVRWRASFDVAVGARIARSEFSPRAVDDIAVLEISRRSAGGPRR